MDMWPVFFDAWMMHAASTSPATGSLERGRFSITLFVTGCGVAVAVGGLLTWMTPRAAKGSLGMDHTSLSRMLVYTWDNDAPFIRSVALPVMVYGALMVVGGLLGMRIFTVFGSVLALGTGGMWIGLAAHHFSTPRLPNSYYLNPLHIPWSTLHFGAWLSICGAGLGLFSTLVLPGWNPALKKLFLEPPSRSAVTCQRASGS
jgi:hypothetical protein